MVAGPTTVTDVLGGVQAGFQDPAKEYPASCRDQHCPALGRKPG